MDRRNREPSCTNCSSSFSFKDPTNPIGARCPLLLNCGHSVCEGCMRSSIRGRTSVKCNCCSVVSEANQFKTSWELREEFPLNVYAVGQIALKRSVKMKPMDSIIGFYSQKEKLAPSTVLCGECGTNPAVCSCRQCNDPFCDSCFTKVHSSGVTLRKHEKIALNAVDKIPAYEEIICQEHPNQTYNFYCNDCSKYFCVDCKSHITHMTIGVDEKNEELFKEFSEAFDEANAVLKQLHATQKKIRSGGMYDEEALAVEKRVSIHYNHLHGLLQLEEEQFLSKIKNAQEKTHGSLMNVSSNIENNIKEMETILAESQSSVKGQNLFNVPLFHMLEKLRNISAMPCHLVLNEEQDNSKYGFFIGGDVMEMLKGHCTVTVPSKRSYELRSKFDLPDNYIENVSNLQDPVKNTGFNSLNLDVLKNKAFVKNKVLPKTLPQTEVKTKNTYIQDVQQQLLDVFSKAQLQTFPRKEIADDSLSTSSADSALESICDLCSLVEGTTEPVRMCHLITPSDFYIQRKSCFSLLEKLGEHFSKQANIKRQHPDCVKCGQMYLVQFAADTKWYRGIVKEENGSKCNIFYVDYGNTETVLIKKLREIPDKFMKMPGQAIHCSLFGCAPIGDMWHEGAIKLMASLSNGVELSMYVERVNHSSGLHEVYLRSIDDKLGSFTDALIFHNCARQTESTLSQGLFGHLQSIKLPTYTDVYIGKGEKFDAHITNINTPENFYMQRISGGGKFMEQLKNDLNSTYCGIGADDLLIHNPSVGMPVAAMFSDGQWYRAVVIKIPKPCFVEILYVDFGNVETIIWNKVRVLHQKFLKTGVLALKCKLSDVAPKYKGWTISAKRTFENMAKKGVILRVHVDDVIDKKLSITLYEPQRNMDICINALLVKKGHAISTGLNSTRVEFLREMEHQTDSDLLSNSSSKYRHSLKNGQLEERVLTRTPSSSSDISQIWEQSGEACRIKIKIVKYVTPSEIYVTFESVRKQIMKLNKEMTAFYATSEVENHDWSLGELCAVYNEKKKSWNRGLISKISLNSYQVFLKDSADEVEVSYSELRTLQTQFETVMDGAIRCHLCAVLPAGGKVTWPAGHYNFMIETFDRYSELYMNRLGDVVDGSLPVQLWTKHKKQDGALEPVNEEWKDINQTLILSGYALPDRSSEHYSALQKESDQSSTCEFISHTFELAAQSPSVTCFEKLNKDSPVPNRGISNLRRQPIAARNSTRDTKIAEAFENLDVTAIKNMAHYNIATDWKPAEPFDELEFVAIPTYVDYDCAIYLQDKKKCKYNLDLIKRALVSLHGGSSPTQHDLEWSKGQICIAFYELDNTWYRGKVINSTMKGVEVLFVDYGNTETLQPEQLRKQIALEYIPIQCHRCLTEGIIPISQDGKWPIKTLDFIHGSIVDRDCHVTLLPPKTEDGNYIIMNFKLTNGDDLMQLLLSMRFATYLIDCNQVRVNNDKHINELDSTESLERIERTTSNIETTNLTPENMLQNNTLSTKYQNSYINDWFDKHEFTPELMKSELGFKELILPDSLVELCVDVPVVSSSSSVRVTITSCEDDEVMAVIKKFTKLQCLIQKEADHLPRVIQPIKGLPCIGCFTEDNEWYRAVIVDIIDKERVKVQYVDYGNEESLQIERLREIKEEWLKIPAQALRVFLHNIIKGAEYEQELCHQMLMSSFQSSPYLMSIQVRQPCLQVEIFDSNGELAYQPVIDFGLLALSSNN